MYDEVASFGDVLLEDVISGLDDALDDDVFDNVEYVDSEVNSVLLDVGGRLDNSSEVDSVCKKFEVVWIPGVVYSEIKTIHIQVFVAYDLSFESNNMYEVIIFIGR